MAEVTQLALLGVVAVTVVARARGRRRWTYIAGGLLAGAWLALTGGAVWAMSTSMAADLPPKATDPGNPCVAGAPARSFNVSLINIPIFLNRFGDVVPEGRMYVLDENVDRVRREFAQAADPFHQADLIEPLVVRAHRGDCVTIRFTNRLNEAAPSFVRDNSIFLLPGEQLAAAGTVTPEPRRFAPARTRPHNDFNPAAAPAASIHMEGLAYDVKGSDGTAAGSNPDSTVAPGASGTYRYSATVEGEFHFNDGADLSSVETGAGNAIGSHSFGAFGAIVVEKPGTSWVDARTGAPLTSGTRAVIKDPASGAPDHREHVIFMHDEVEAASGILTRFCRGQDDVDDDRADGECVDPTATELSKLKRGTLPGLSGGDADALVQGEIPVKLEWFAFNYRAEPGFNREEIGCPQASRAGQGFDAQACHGEETALSSWAYGDPGGGDLVFANYRGEPMQIRLLHAAERETHTFHWHVNRWPFDPKDEGGLAEVSKPSHHMSVTNILDVQAVSPGAHYALMPEGGAGSAHDTKPATFGDVIFHCHLYPHFANGMWALNRTHDKLETGTRKLPDGTVVPALLPLEDFDYQPAVSGINPPPTPTATKPGYPHFVPGKFGFKAPKPPLGVASRQAAGVFPPTQLEREAADAGAQTPGGFFQNPCPATRSDGRPTPTKTFDVAAIQVAQYYNEELRWKNPQARVYVLQDQKQAVLDGRKPEPFAPLFNVGDCVVYNFTNELPENFGGNVFDRAQITNEAGIHQHLVQFDVLSSDGAANGWNYDQGADRNQTITYRSFVHEDFATSSFHDHFFPNVHQDNGLLGGATVHPTGCTYHDPKTGTALRVGTVVDIHCSPGTDYHGKPIDDKDYRNFSIFVEDHVPMFKPADPNDPNDDQFVTPDGVPIYPPKFPSSPDDQGVVGLSYRLEPFEGRRGADPSRVYDQRTHGAAYTTTFTAHEGDRVKWRLFQLSQEESHGFTVDRFPWKSEPRDPESNLIQAQHLGVLEYFDMNLDMGGEFGWQDWIQTRRYVYGLTGSDDRFLGAWGHLRVMDCDDPKGEGNYEVRLLPDNPQCTGVGGGTKICDGSVAGPGVKQFTVVAFNHDIVYNKSGDHDPNGAMFALEEDVNAIRSGQKPPEPLVLRAHAGDCIQVTLKNQLDPTKMKQTCFEATEPGQLGWRRGNGNTLPGCLDQPPKDEHNVPGFKPYPVSSRVGLTPTLLDYYLESRGSNTGDDGELVGDLTVGVGESRVFTWYAPQDVTGLALLQDQADPLHHGHHGLFGGLVIEPKGTSWVSPRDGTPLRSGTQAVVVDPNGKDYRENIVLLNSDLALFRNNGSDVPDNVDLAVSPSRETDDPEDSGEVAVNYRNEPWNHRYAADANLSRIFSSYPHGDPSTPLMEAYTGDKTVIWVGQAVGKPRSTGFTLHGHTWRASPKDPQSQIKAFQGEFNPGSVYQVVLDPDVTNGAGGPARAAGDYLYRSNTLSPHLTGGQWGLFRVYGSSRPGLFQLPDHPVG
ncbi:hypothetical protein DKT68_19055 [Micromonospora acroterricola]|uniref:Multicopper oxidase n=1 Tax=Micromonospora acroterricola TaxID=2202421 RepID=A0A317D475_9ACTN|nr:hypothetical protein [Micromonospora acroterricola]PWR07463.1 hypothetical protein DKT68_19055 [Micromonospora acroterricola]